MVVKVRVWALRDNSYPDLYMNVNRDECTPATSDWKSNQIGDNELTIYPDNKKYKKGIYRCAIEAFKGSEEHHIGIAVYLREAKPIIQLKHSDPPLHTDVKDCMFFMYSIEDTSDLERLLLLLNVTNRKNLQVYVHRKNYPSQLEGEFTFAAGDLPDQVLQQFKNMYLMAQLL